MCIRDSKKTVLPVVPKIVTAMQESVAAKGVAEAIPVCKELAPALIKEKRQETGWDIRRVSLKTRNAERGTPDLWEVRQLADFNTVSYTHLDVYKRQAAPTALLATLVCGSRHKPWRAGQRPTL